MPNNNSSDLCSESQPSSSSMSLVPLPSFSSDHSPPTLLSETSEAPESKEEKRKRMNKESCKNSREKKKKKTEEEQRELERLKERNQELKATIKGMEEVVAWHKSLLRDASRKRKGEGGCSGQGGKKKRQ